MSLLENTPFEQLTIGQTASLTRTLTEDDLILFAKVSGDTNPVHLDEEYAAGTQFGGRIAHGMWTASIISCALATKLPGPGGIYLGQELSFLRPVMVGDTITVQLEITEINERRKRATVSTNVINQHSKAIVKGKAEIMPAVNAVRVEPYPLPEVTFS